VIYGRRDASKLPNFFFFYVRKVCSIAAKLPRPGKRAILPW